jgi:hypothetical protein
MTKTMRHADFLLDIQAQLAERLPDFSVRLNDDLFSLESSSPRLGLSVGCLVTIKADLNQHPTGEKQGCYIFVRLPERMFTPQEATTQGTLLARIGPILEEMEAKYKDTRMWK